VNASEGEAGRRDPREQDLHWLKEVYAGDGSPQLTARATITGAVLGAVLALSNLYAGLKTGWAFSVGITAIILSFSFWRLVSGVFGERARPGILEDNCMQATASGAGYAIVSIMVTAIPAYMLVTGVVVAPIWLMLWAFFAAALGLMLFIPFKRQLINHEQLVFPTGVATAETLRGLHASGGDAVQQARGLYTGMGLGALGIWLGNMNGFRWWRVPRLPDSLSPGGGLAGVGFGRLTVGVDLSGVALAGGALIGLRISSWMLAGSALTYLLLAPWLVSGHYLLGEIHYGVIQHGFALWLGSALMVGASLTDLFFQRRTVGRALAAVLPAFRRSGGDEPDDSLAGIEVPGHWFVVGSFLSALGLLITGMLAFAIGFKALVATLILSLLFVVVAARAVGETDLVPVGQLGKLAQLGFGAIAPGRLSVNLMSTGVTTTSAACAADLATNLKCGYLLGSNPRQLFLAQFLGTVVGALVVVPAFYVLVPDPALLGTTSLPAPAAAAWRAIAELLSGGIQALDPAARVALSVGFILGILLSVLGEWKPDRRWTPSAFGLGLGIVIPFSQSAAFVLGALLALLARRMSEEKAERYTVPVASGIIAGESLLGVVFGTLGALGLLS
jgi:uncharacterized oligopeptide transporter (OPT) family protein